MLYANDRLMIVVCQLSLNEYLNFKVYQNVFHIIRVRAKTFYTYTYVDKYKYV